MTLDIFQIDAFAKGPFTGNPAAVVPLDSWLPDQILQDIASENNLSETAYFIKQDGAYHIRWFTPNVEVNLCGHATLATAHVLYAHLGFSKKEIVFNSKSGKLYISKKNDTYELNFPTDNLQEIKPDTAISEAIGVTPLEWYRGRDDYMLVLASEEVVKEIMPNFTKLSTCQGRGCLVTAQSYGAFDFVSRGFFPQCGINEDPATGSAHTSLTPYWSKKLNKKELSACQLSARKGYFKCTDLGDRTQISGKCNDYLVGKITI